ncbi:Hypothetical protein D9617_109g007540 [Elsinoe fawcettii]|nr:Hypothetical protein D9617_109g007540 [Elsinoe fawcettii]
MKSVEPSNPQVQDLPALQSSIVSPLSFCKVWNKSLRKDASPFSKVSPLALSRLCTAIVKNPKLVAPRGKSSSSSSIRSSSSVQTSATSTLISSSSRTSIVASQITTVSTTGATTTTSHVTSSTATCIGPGASADPGPDSIAAPQIILDPTFKTEITYETTNDGSLAKSPSWSATASVKNSLFQPANFCRPLRAANFDLNSDVTMTATVNMETKGFAEAYYVIVLFWDGWCNLENGCFVVAEMPNEKRSLIGFPGFGGKQDLKRATQMTSPQQLTSVVSTKVDATQSLTFKYKRAAQSSSDGGAQMNIYNVALYGPVDTYDKAWLIQETLDQTSSMVD